MGRGGPWRCAARTAPGQQPKSGVHVKQIAQDGVSTVIPGARSVEQVRGNASAADTGDLGREIDAGVRRIYDAYFRADIHPRW